MLQISKLIQSNTLSVHCQPASMHRHHLLHHKLDNEGRKRHHSMLSLIPLLLIMLLSLSQCPTSNAFIVPNELPSILSLVYSNIPVIKKGTDSRIGIGFRLGEHADFQLVTELGPQKETRPIGDQDNSDGSSFNKRQVNKTQQRAVLREVAKTEKTPSTWLEKWSNAASSTSTTAKKKVSSKDINNKKPLPPKLDNIQMLPPHPSQVSSEAMQQLQLLYKMATATSSTNEQKPQPTTTTVKPLNEAAAFHLHERLKVIKAPSSQEDLQELMHKTQDQQKAEVTKELMDVTLDE